MLSVRGLLSSFAGCLVHGLSSRSRNVTSNASLKENWARDLGKLLEELRGISRFVFSEQKDLRDAFLRNYIERYTEPVVLNVLSEIYLDNDLEKDVKNQAVLCINSVLNNKPNKELHGFICDGENNHPFARRWGIHELVERKDHSANLAFVYRVIVDSSVDVRKAAALALGELGGSAVLDVLENIPKSDPIYNEAQEAIRSITRKLSIRN